MTHQPAKTPPPEADLLDSPEVARLIDGEGERAWTEQPNAILARHPFLGGYLFLGVIGTLLLVTHLMTFVISFLFLYLISDFLTNDLRRRLHFMPKAVLFSVLYVAVIAVVTVLSYRVIPNLLKQLPALAQAVQAQLLAQFESANERWNMTRYIDPDEVRGAVVSVTTSALRFLGRRFSTFYTGFIYFVFALVINLLLYHDTTKLDLVFDRRPASLLSYLYRFTLRRVRVFYYYFKRVMGGQIIISAVNTVISLVFILALHLPSPVLLLSLVFFFGLFPVVGNIVSNTILTATALVAIGPWAAVVCLGLLVGVHKLEYFLNSKIIGEIVHLPMVVTLAALVVCEVLLGIVGLILAIPLTLSVRHELEHIPGHAPE